MALTCRWVCKSTFSVNFDELEKRFKSNIFSTFKKGKTELKYLVTDRSMATAESGAKYLRGTLSFECEEVLKLRQITDDAKIAPDNKTLKYADVVDFWISDKNFIVFSKTERSKNMQPMRRLMSEILFEQKDRIRPILFDIENIEKDLISTKKVPYGHTPSIKDKVTLILDDFGEKTSAQMPSMAKLKNRQETQLA